MSKALEALKRIRQETCPATYMSDFDKTECCDVIEKALQRLEAIDNANPSEALKDLAFIKEKFAYLEYNCETFNVPKKELCNIEQALLKAQEQEKENELLKEIIKRY